PRIRKYLPITRLFLHILCTCLCFFGEPFFKFFDIQNNNLKIFLAVISYFLTFSYIGSLFILKNQVIILILLILSQISTISIFFVYNSFFGLLFFLLTCFSFDYFLIWLRRKKSVTIENTTDLCVYMRRNIVVDRTVVLHMGEFVQLINSEDFFTQNNSTENAVPENYQNSTIKVRKFNGEEFDVHRDDIVRNVEEVVGHFD
ncbi:hypothetical protein M153_18240001, partial [Pseudoloma neurophilia]